MTNIPILNTLLERILIQPSRLLPLQHPHKPNQILILLYPHQKIPSIRIHLNRLWEQPLDISHDLEGFVVLDVEGDAIAGAVTVFEVDGGADAFQPALD